METKTLTFTEKVALNKQKADTMNPKLQNAYELLQGMVESMRKAADEGKPEYLEYFDINSLSHNDQVDLIHRLQKENPEEATFINLKTRQSINYVNGQTVISYVKIIAFQF